MKKAVIFDLDGTLLNTLYDLANAVNYSLKKHGYKQRSVEFVRNAIGNGVAVLIERCLPNGKSNPEYDIVLSDFKDYYRSHCNVETKPYKNVLETLKTLHNQGILLAVVTNKVDDIAKDIINYYYPGLFTIIQGDVKSLPKKPAPDMVNKVIKELNIDKKDILYVGDTNVDYEMSNNADIDVVLISHGYRTKEQLINYHYNVPIIDDMFELLELVK